jgi:hypothetical protein
VDTAVSNTVKNADGAAWSPHRHESTESYCRKFSKLFTGVLRRADAPVCPDYVRRIHEFVFAFEYPHRFAERRFGKLRGGFRG